MVSIIYTSVAQKSLAREEILRMLNRSKRRNKVHGISGCIFFHKGTFIQLIEGEKEVVHRLYENIRRDKRHYEVQLILKKETEKRTMLDWSMAYFDLTGEATETAQRRLLLENLFKSTPGGPEDLVLLRLKKAVYALLVEEAD